MGSLLERYSPATAHNRYRALKTSSAWAEDEDEIERSPMANMSPPFVPEPETQVLTEKDLTKLLKAYAGKGFAERRDTAIIRLFIDTGLRRNEISYGIGDD
jgi:integrase